MKNIMKKNIAIVVFLGCFMLLVFSASDNSMKRITESRYQSTGIFSSSKYRFGDLFGICYLKDFKIKTGYHVDKSLKVDQLPRDLSLYMICDSYVFEPFEGKSNYFSRVKDFHILKLKEAHWDLPKLNTKNKNVLVFEIVLRNIYNHMNLKNITLKSDFSNLSTSRILNTSAPNQSISNESLNLFGLLKKCIGWVIPRLIQSSHHKNVETHLEFIMFDFDFFRPLKVLKAEWILKYFNRINGGVVLSKDRKFLFMEDTVIPTFKGSSTYPISDLNIEEQVNKINLLNEFFKSKGFDEVLFSIIPNPYDLVSANELGQNNQLKRLLAYKNLKAKMLDITPKLSINAKNNFFQSDTHWNSNGATIWLTEINQYLNSIPQ
jgi:hypothetical protein